jgi:hypothetical protein
MSNLSTDHLLHSITQDHPSFLVQQILVKGKAAGIMHVIVSLYRLILRDPWLPCAALSLPSVVHTQRLLPYILLFDCIE